MRQNAERGRKSSSLCLPAEMRLVATDPRNPPPSSAATRAVMKANRGSRTRPEALLAKALRFLGASGFARNHRTQVGRIDLCFRRERVAVLVHGCFWHRCQTCRLPLPKSHREFWMAKFRRNRARDRRLTRNLEELGWTVREVWEHEIEHQPRVAARRITRVLTQRRANERSKMPMSRRGGG